MRHTLAAGERAGSMAGALYRPWGIDRIAPFQGAYRTGGGGLTLTDGPIDLDHTDSFPRFFFSSREADEHTRTFLKWRHRKARTFPHALEAA